MRTFAAWRVGRKGLDDGLVLFVFAKDRKVRIEVGYGLEDQVPDAIASRIIREVIVPRIQAGDQDGALAAGVGALLEAIGPDLAGRGAPAPAPAGPARAARRLTPPRSSSRSSSSGSSSCSSRTRPRVLPPVQHPLRRPRRRRRRRRRRVLRRRRALRRRRRDRVMVRRSDAESGGSGG